MSESKNTRLIRQVSVGIVIGFIIGLVVGWFVIGWWLWPVKYEQAYTYQLVDDEKQQYVAAVVDSYNLTKQLGVAQGRFNAWTVEEKVTKLTQLFAEYLVQGKMQEAQQVAALAAELQRVEGWAPAVVNEVTNQVANQYAGDGEPAKAQAASQFASELTGAAPPVAQPPAAAAPQPDTERPILGDTRVLAVCGVLLLGVGLIALILIVSRQRQSRQRPAGEEAEPVWVGEGPPPLLQRTSSYVLGMDNLDESFAIETEDNEWLGECGMGISESLDDGTPRRVTAFEVWLFDKLNTLTITKVLMSDYANNNETLRNKLASRGEPVLAAPGGAFTLETPDLIVEAQIVDMEYGEDTPAYGYFNRLEIMLTAHQKPETETSGEIL